MKPLYIAGAILLFLAWQRGAHANAATQQIQESIPVNGTDWMTDQWQRLFGADLGYRGSAPGITCSSFLPGGCPSGL
jgi:hypothetical protein